MRSSGRVLRGGEGHPLPGGKKATLGDSGASEEAKGCGQEIEGPVWELSDVTDTFQSLISKRDGFVWEVSGGPVHEADGGTLTYSQH